MNRETKLTNKITKYLRSKGTLVIKYHGNEFSRIGVPDLICCYEGEFIAIEIKVGNNKPSPIQNKFIEIINEDYKGKAIWVNEENWKEEIDKIICTNKKHL